MTLITFLPHTTFKKKNVLSFLICIVISMGKVEKVKFLYVTKEIHFFHFSHGNDNTFKKTKDIFFLKWGMGKKKLLVSFLN